jgi:hypothetical protein
MAPLGPSAAQSGSDYPTVLVRQQSAAAIGL